MPLCLAYIVNDANMRMIERRSGTRLALETFPRSFGRKGQWQGFESYIALEPRVPRTIHLAHAAFTDGRKDFVRAEFSAYSKGHVMSQLSLTDRELICTLRNG